MTNPLLAEWHTPFQIAPFDRISDDDFAPAFEVRRDPFVRVIGVFRSVLRGLIRIVVYRQYVFTDAGQGLAG